jgi:hypothetical protein
VSTQCERCYQVFLDYRVEQTHVCPRLVAEKVMKERQIVIQLPDKPGAEYDDLLIALQMLIDRQARNKTETP